MREMDPEAWDWELIDANGVVQLSGSTMVYGDHSRSDEHLHWIDFSSFTGTGTDFKIRAGSKESQPFDIAADVYDSLADDSLAYYYHNRSGIDIEAQYVGAEWARPAGHVSDTATCFDKIDNKTNGWIGCSYTLDGSKGWYDAGDHGKYVVNSGISVWTLLNAYERAVTAGATADMADGTAQIPENNNGVPDVLDEVRWNIEFMLGMQVPDGRMTSVIIGNQSANENNLVQTQIDAAGMAHHKLADENWTGIPTPPHQSTETRYLYPPSTSATLHLAGIGAQCARIWATIDPTFSAQCLAAATKAYDAAVANPEIYAYDNFTGSGPYGDTNVNDEFYWAAAELFITTGDSQYQTDRDTREASLPSNTSIIGQALAWPNMFLAGDLSRLAQTSSATGGSNTPAGRIIALADEYVRQRSIEGYAMPYAEDRYLWGSNSDIGNRALILLTSHELTGNADYRNSAIDALDYMMGRNPLDISFVTGYGEVSAQNPHHRFWAQQANANFPGPPPGVLIGGPNNTALVDPIAQTITGCLPQLCWVDDYRAFTLTEVTINWNAPLYWMSTYLNRSEP